MASSSSTTNLQLDRKFNHSTNLFDYEIHWTSLGSPCSQPLVFVHGTPWSSHVWHAYAQSLAKYFHVYLFDNPGFGDSPLGKPIAPKDISAKSALDADLAQQSEVFAEMFKFWAKDWPSGGAHVIAHDHGGLMSLRAHLLHGCEYRSMCLIDAVALGPWGQPLFQLISENAEVFESLTGPVFEGIVEAYIREAAQTALTTEAMEKLKAPWISSEEGRKGFVRQMAQASSRSTEEVERIYPRVGKKMPVKVIWGKEDKWIPVERAVKLKEKLNAQDLVEIDGAGHLVMYDQPNRLGIELGWWLAIVK